MKLTVAGTAMAAVALVALATAPQAAASPEDEFLAALADGGISVPSNATGNVIGGGHGVCRGWASGASYADGVADVTGALGGNQSLARVFVRAATSVFCPKYASKLP
jgi:hypothetical protein